ncbi:MAG: SPFH domain-containing protein, partial [Bacteroidetes bacterium]|nr:SPFH domain-containing protein [Bacteroidota bacterium]
MKQEKIIKPISGYLMFVIVIGLILSGIYFLINKENPQYLIFIAVAFIILKGLVLVNPNNSRVLLLFGKYIGSIKTNGLFWVNPLYKRKKISLRASNFDSERLKVNDKLGNPIMISTILVWRVTNTYKASFDVDNYENFVRVQTDAAVRKLASMYPYDNFADEGLAEDITLRSSVNEVSEALEKEVEERLAIAGIEVLEARIGYLAYAQE